MAIPIFAVFGGIARGFSKFITREVTRSFRQPLASRLGKAFNKPRFTDFVRPNIRVQVIDRGWNRIKANLLNQNVSFTKVGLPLEGTTTGRYSMHKLANVGWENEFGSGKTPSRSFMRSAIDENKNKIFGLLKFHARQITGGKITVRSSLKIIGKTVEKMIKNKIMSNIPPPNVFKRLGKKTLIDTGQMLNSIQHIEIIK